MGSREGFCLRRLLRSHETEGASVADWGQIHLRTFLRTGDLRPGFFVHDGELWCHFFPLRQDVLSFDGFFNS